MRGTGGNPVTVTNNGTVSNTSGATDTSVLVHGLVVEGNGGLVTYRGNGSAATNATPPAASPAYGVIMTNANGGGIDIGSAAAPVTGVFSGQGGFNVRAETGGPINAWFHGGTFTSTQASAGALRLFTRDNINLVMTGGSVLTGELRVQVLPNAPATAAATITTDARITQTLGPAMTVAGGRGGTDVTIAAGAAITGQASGLSMFQDGGVMRLTTAAGSTIRGNDAIGIGVQLQPDAGSVIADIAGDVSGSGGLFLVPADGNVDVTIREGATVTGTDVGVTVQRLPGGTGVVDILNLGTISSANTAADFDGTLRIGNGGTAGTISGDIANRGTLIFNRSDALTYGGRISGTGALTKQGAGTLTLTGASTYSGATHVAAGTLLVNGSLASAVTVAGGATLGGAGSVGTSTVNGTLSPGGDGTIGTLTVNGNLVFGAGSSFRVDVGNGSNDRVNVTGTASLAGSLTAIAINGGFTSGTFTLLNAAERHQRHVQPADQPARRAGQPAL
ncbi:autotransporter-associated beta strand repeat-containing protein [Sphingopyxis sp. PET50]|uniref:beta strand repeat-containing protein n=1 Tax=Sphingopyxis sp. PET50 TaxID=2976533 RepID=UPI0021AFA3E7|nr:autotransporter-associated beta strand repeat-containing protein [Sphingopyxis sp. PET50]